MWLTIKTIKKTNANYDDYLRNLVLSIENSFSAIKFNTKPTKDGLSFRYSIGFPTNYEVNEVLGSRILRKGIIKFSKTHEHELEIICRVDTSVLWLFAFVFGFCFAIPTYFELKSQIWLPIIVGLIPAAITILVVSKEIIKIIKNIIHKSIIDTDCKVA